MAFLVGSIETTGATLGMPNYSSEHIKNYVDDVLGQSSETTNQWQAHVPSGLMALVQ
jgi:hypothetical protein